MILPNHTIYDAMAKALFAGFGLRLIRVDLVSQIEELTASIWDGQPDIFATNEDSVYTVKAFFNFVGDLENRLYMSSVDVPMRTIPVDLMKHLGDIVDQILERNYTYYDTL